MSRINKFRENVIDLRAKTQMERVAVYKQIIFYRVKKITKKISEVEFH